MKKNNYLIMLNMLFAVALVTSNVIAGKLMYVGFNLFGSPVSLNVGALAYPLTFLLANVIAQVWGRREASKTILFGMLAQTLSTVVITLAGLIPALNEEISEPFKIVLGQNWLFVTGSLMAYFISQLADIYLFAKVKNKIEHKVGDEFRGIWNKVGVLAGQLLDTVVFVSIVFGFGFGWFFDGGQMNVLAMILGQFLLKAVISLIDTPLFYLMTRKKAKE